MRVFWSPPGEISRDGCWVCFESCFMFTGSSLLGLLWQVVTEWRNERHLIG